MDVYWQTVILGMQSVTTIMTETLLTEVSLHFLDPTGLTSHFMPGNPDCFQKRRDTVGKQAFCAPPFLFSLLDEKNLATVYHAEK